MTMKMAGGIKSKNITGWLLAGIVSIILLFPLMHLEQGDLSIPFQYEGDTLLCAAMIKGMIDNGWYYENHSLGAPHGLLMYDFLNTDSLHYLVMKAISFFVPDYAAVMNLYFLLTFPLTTLCALYVLRKFNLSYPVALVGALLFTFLPYHFLRGEAHLFLSSYYMIPLCVLLVFRAWNGERPGVIDVLICVLAACSVVYYAFFTCLFLALAGAVNLLKSREFKSLTTTAILIGCILLVVLINLSPSLIYQSKHGVNKVATNRRPVEAEILGLKVTQMLLPVNGHRIKTLAELNAGYSKRAPLINENRFASLGFIGGIGFIFLILRAFHLLLVKRENPAPPWADIDTLGILNIAAVLFAVIGGFGPFLSLFYPKFRGLNRISIFIAFFSFMAVGLLLQHLYLRWCITRVKKVLFYTGLCLVLVWGIYDQTTPQYIPNYEYTKLGFDSDRDFITRIEAQLPPNAMVFQLPYVPYPENSFKGMYPYDHFRAYLHSRSLRFSYGVMKGREGDAWQRRTISLSLDEFLEALAFNGFQGIYLNRTGLFDYTRTGRIGIHVQDSLDRQGFPEKGENLEQKLCAKLQCVPLVSQDKKLVFFSLEKKTKEKRGQAK